MTDFNSISALGELTALPQTPLLDLGAASREGGGWAGVEEGKGEGKGREGKGAPKLLLNQRLATPLIIHR